MPACFQDAVTSSRTKDAAMLCHTLDWSEKKPKETPDTKKSEHNKETMGSRKEEVSQDTLQMQAGSRQP